MVASGVTDAVPVPGQLTVPTPLLMLQEAKPALPAVAVYVSVVPLPAVIVVGDAEREHEGGEYAATVRGKRDSAQQRKIAANTNDVRSSRNASVRHPKLSYDCGFFRKGA